MASRHTRDIDAGIRIHFDKLNSAGYSSDYASNY